jgi:hypothetical protein
MAKDPNDVLRQAMEFYIAGHIIEARALLLDLVRVNPQLEAGWLFLSYTLDDPAQKQDCLRQVLLVNPENEEAKAKLEQLQSGKAGPRRPEAPPAQPPSVKPGGLPARAPQERGSHPVDESRTAPNAAPLPHASPFTVDISHATDAIPENPLAEDQPSSTNPFLPGEGASRKPEGSPGAPQRPVSISERGQPSPAQRHEAMGAAKPERLAGTAVRPAKASPQIKKKSGGHGCLYAFLVGGLGLVGMAFAGWWLFSNGYLPLPSIPGDQDTPTAVPQSTETMILWTLPPEWTVTPASTPTPQATITATPTQTETPTLAPPTDEIRAAIDVVEKQVAGLRGLTWTGTLPVYFVDQDRAEAILQEMLQESGYPATVEDRKKILVALGLLRKTFNLSAFEASHLADSVEAFYSKRDQAVYILSDRFDVWEKELYAHEFDHALQSLHFPSADILDNDPLCREDSQRCEAVRALVEGDATFLELEWYERYVGTDSGLTPTITPQLTPQFVPPFFSQDAQFSYVYGAKFIAYLWKIGQWSKVNEAYQNPPQSTEQILHPGKFILKEKPVVLNLPDLEKILGSGWRKVGSDVLGEYMTYLVLGYGMDVSAIESQSELADLRDRALEAAAGWGGDKFEIRYDDRSQQTVLVAEWVWDYPKDETEFALSMKEYLNFRFRGGTLNRSGADCWQYNRETACVFQTATRTLWILAPDMPTLDVLLTAFPDFS